MTGDIQFVYDTSGHKTAVIIPIALWEKSFRTEGSQKKCDISRFFGVYRGVIPDADSLARSLRDDWDRILSDISLIPIF